jgi:transcriptional repressor NrdR
MRCPFCLERESRVIDSREVSDGLSIRRRRECTNCHRRFTTYERYQQAAMMVVKKDGRREEFDPSKLRQKLRVALTKRPVGEKELDSLIQRVEGQLLALGVEEVPTQLIGEAVLRELKSLDEIAYIRFASVYREFADLEDVRREMEGLGTVRRTADPNAGA